MSPSIVFCGVLVILTVVASIPTVRNEFEPEIIFDFIPENQDTFQISPSSWQSTFGDRYAYEIEDTPEVKDLFSTSQISVISSASGRVEQAIKYTIGKRTKNDRIVSHGVDGGKWSSPANVTLTMTYPSSGQGAKVTFAEFFVNQSSKIGQVRVTAGGIGQRLITIVLDANNTLFFAYKGLIYGV